MIGEILLVIGALFILLAALGILRFDDVFVRMQVLSKASTFGILCVLAGGMASLTTANDLTFLVLAGALHLVTSPIGVNLLARATYLAPGIPFRIDAADDLAARTPTEPGRPDEA
jgi:multicomponent Na+:H+ antiporter subunit G